MCQLCGWRSCYQDVSFNISHSQDMASFGSYILKGGCMEEDQDVFEGLVHGRVYS